MRKVVVIGGGQAAASCVAKLRSRGFDGSITLIGEEPALPYQRPPLSKGYLLGEMALDRLFLRPAAWYADNAITVHLNERATRIDRDAKTVQAGGHDHAYDDLVLCTGSIPRQLPAAIGGALEGVRVVRTLADVDAMAPGFAAGKHVLVVGGGYIGLEAAAVAAKLGMKVTLVEAAERILGRVASPETSDYFRKLHGAHGVDIREGTGLVRLLGDGHVTGAELGDGTTLDIDFAIVGETIEEDRFLIMHNGTCMADMPLSRLSSSAPEYDRPHVPTPQAEPLADVPQIDPIDGLKGLISSPNYASKAWVFEQYDSQVMADTVRIPGFGAGVIRIDGTDKKLAFTSDVTPRYVRANPVEGGKQAVAEAFRNLTAVGAKPLATTDNLNFGNPEKPEIMGQFVGALDGIGQACIALDMPIVSGNVSLYNETDGQGILPTPTIGAVGLIAADEQPILDFARDGHVALVIGRKGEHLGQSALLYEVFNREDGDAPHVDLAEDRRHGHSIRAPRARSKCCTDSADGGRARAACERAEASGVGVHLDTDSTAELFGEDQGRYLVACNFDQAEALMGAAAKAGVDLHSVGRFTGDTVRFGASEAALADLSGLYRSTFSDIFG